MGRNVCRGRWAAQALLALLGLAALGLAALGLTACGGYRLTGGSMMLDEKFRELAIDEVRNPSLETTLEPRLRAMTRDELTRRGGVRWVDAGRAKSLLRYNIKRFLLTSQVKGVQDVTLKYKAEIELSARILNKEDGRVLWDSGSITVTESYYAGGEDEAENLVLELAVRRVADLLGEGY